MATNRVLSREDGNLSTSLIISSRSRTFKDIDLSFTPKDNGELYTKTDAAAVKQAVKNLIQTNYFEKPFQPLYGADLRSLLFELADDDIEEDIQDQIGRAIAKYEPRALLRNVFVDSQPDRNMIRITIEFQVVNSDEIVTFSTSLSRLR
jgi:phage baseplate assembly protein W